MRFVLTRALVPLLLLLLFPALSRAAALPAVETVEAYVTAQSAPYPLPLQVEKRMQASVRTIADNVLMGRAVAEVGARRESYEALVQDVFGRILFGYSVTGVQIEPGAQARVYVRVAPWPDVIEDVAVTLQGGAVHRDLEPLLQADLEGVRAAFAQVLVGLPAEAVEWTRGVVRMCLAEYLEAHLPEFGAEFEIRAGKRADVRLFLYPKGNLVRSVDVRVRSSSLPNAALLGFRQHLQQRADALRGTPVAFLDRHKAAIEASLTEAFSSNALLDALGAGAHLALRAGAQAEVEAQAETDRYRISLEGYLDIGRDEDNTSFKLHAGQMLSPLDELYFELDFVPHSMRWNFQPGYARQIAPQTQLGLRYDTDESASVFWAKQRLADKWLLRFEHTPHTETNLFSVRYDLHEFVGVEYVFSDENWLRLVGYF